MRVFLIKGLAETHALWADVEAGYRWVHRAAYVLTNDEGHTATQVHQTYEMLLTGWNKRRRSLRLSPRCSSPFAM